MDMDFLARVRAERRRLATDGPPHTRDVEGDFERIAVPAVDGDVVRDLLIRDTTSSVIEIGLAYGSSALAIGEALVANTGDRGEHTIIDPYQTSTFQDAGWRVVSDAGLAAMCTLIQERSQIALPRLVAEGHEADAAFVDGSHHFHNVFVDLFYLGELVRAGGLVVLDDYQWPSVATAVRYFELNRGWRMLQESSPAVAGRIRALRLPEYPVEESFEDFQPFCDCN